ncbi:uncharacterized protein E1O_27160 [Burkholderiales bacterium GJ-E10]|nr:uncharacterized protein E1O_27160 [Burkholderiales bacterium GJ-E10]
MRLVGRDKLDQFCTEHADCRKWIAAWITDVRETRWRTPQDIKDKYASASMLERNRVIFNVRGNEYRLVTVVAYQVGVVAVEWIGTHAEYSKRY